MSTYPETELVIICGAVGLPRVLSDDRHQTIFSESSGSTMLEATARSHHRPVRAWVIRAGSRDSWNISRKPAYRTGGNDDET